MNALRCPGALAYLAVTFVFAVTSVADEQAGGELVQMVIDLLGDKDNDVRALALEQVRTEAKGRAATEQFAAQLAQLPSDGQVGLLRALSARGDDAARPAVLNMLATSQDESVRVAAINALGSLGRQADLQRLVALLTDDSKAERAAARASLVRLPGDSVSAAIAAETRKGRSPLRVTLIEVLATRRALDTIPEIMRAATDADPTVRMAAMKALGQLAGPEHVAGMVRAVLRAERGREREAAEKNVMFVCGRIEDKQQRAAPLLRVINALERAEKMAILPTLGRVGGSEAQEVVEAAIADSNPKLHEAGLRALCNWPDASIASRLIDLAQTDKHAGHRIMALRALIRIAPLRDGRTDDQRLALLRQAMAMSARDAERNLVLQRAQAIRSPETLRFISPYLDRVPYAQQACQSVVELAHHRELRDAHKAEFDRALDKVIRTSKDATAIERANRYKKGQTWVRPKQ